MLQIHQQKCQIVEHVDAGERVIEFEAIEEGRLTLEQADVPQVKITVAMAHLAGSATAVEER